MRWIMAALAALSTVFVIMPFRFQCFGHISKAMGLTAKVIPTLMCAAFAGTAVMRGGDRYALLIFIGLCVCAVADVVLGIHFVTGGALFFAGHMFYIAAFFTQQPPNWKNALVFGVVLALLWLFLWRFKPLISKPELYQGARIYATALAVVLCLSLPLPFRAFSQRTLLAALGAFIFVLSDMGVCHGMVCRIPRRLDAFYLGIYYLAQLLLGLSTF